MKTSLLIVFLLFTVALVKNFRFLPSSMFESDQEYLALSGQAILNGDFTLIGAPTSVGGMFIGPLYNYLVAGALWLFRGNPLSVNGLSALFVALSIPAFYLVGRLLFSHSAGVIAALVALFSYNFVNLDQVPPLLAPLPLVTLLFIGFGENSTSKTRKSLVMGLLAGLALNLHFSGVFFIPILFISGVLSWIPLLVLLSPLFLFEARNNFVMTRNLFSFASSSIQIGSTAGGRLQAFLAGIGDLIGIGGMTMNLVAFAFVVTALKSSSRLVKYLILTPLAFFLLYNGRLLPYYAIIAWVAVMLFIGELGSRLWANGRMMRIALITVFVMFSIDHSMRWFNRRVSHGLDQKLAALRFIKEQSGNQPIYFSRTIEVGRDFGFEYLSPYVGINHSGDLSDPNYTIVIPARWKEIVPDREFGNIGVVLPKRGSNEQEAGSNEKE